jgi:hypothetical protein
MTYRCSAFKLAAQAEGAISCVERRAWRTMDGTVIELKNTPTESRNVGIQSKVSTEVLRVPGDEDGENKATMKLNS